MHACGHAHKLTLALTQRNMSTWPPHTHPHQSLGFQEKHKHLTLQFTDSPSCSWPTAAMLARVQGRRDERDTTAAAIWPAWPSSHVAAAQPEQHLFGRGHGGKQTSKHEEGTREQQTNREEAD